jgi:tetratricopeptide (TPR) repeat protein
MEPSVRLQFTAARRRLDGDPVDPAANAVLGMLFHAYGLHVLAERCYRRAALLDPGNPRWWSLLGRALVARGEWAAAAAALEAAAALGDEGLATQLLRADSLRQAGVLEEALRHYGEALRRDPSLAPAWCGAGRVLVQRGELESAIRHLERAVELAPFYGSARYALGQALRRLGRLEEARAQLLLAEAHRDREPDVPDPLGREIGALRTGAIEALHRGIDLLREGRVGEARTLLEEAVRLGPDLAEAHSQLGTAQLLSGELDRAEASLDRALEIDPDYVDALYNLGLVAHGRGDLERAVTLFGRAAEVRPRHFDAQLGLGTDLIGLGRAEEGLGALRAAMSLRPADPRPYKRLAAALGALGRFAEAIGTLRAGISLGADDGSIADRLALLLATCPDESLRDPAEALRIADEVCRRSGEKVPEPLETRAVALAALGRYSEAVEAAESALRAAAAGGKADTAQRIRRRLEEYRARGGG